MEECKKTTRWRRRGGGGRGRASSAPLKPRASGRAGCGAGGGRRGGAWPASACPDPQGAVACSPAASPRARVQDSLWAIVAPFLPLCLAFPFLGERLDQGEVELEPRGVRERAQLGPGAAGPFQQRGLPLGRNPNAGVLVSFLPVTLATFVFQYKIKEARVAMCVIM